VSTVKVAAVPLSTKESKVCGRSRSRVFNI